MDRITTYRKALATFEAADAKVRPLIDAMKLAMGDRAGIIANWQRIVPEAGGKTFGCASWLQSYPRVDITWVPHAGELIAALGAWHTAKMILTNTWLRLTPAEQATVPPCPIS